MSRSAPRHPDPEGWVRRWWSGAFGLRGRLLSGALAPLSWVFAGLSGARNAAFDRGLRRPDDAPIPVVSIGNLSVGGTGKTPISAWCTSELVQQGAHPALVTRGYGRDEVELHRRWHPAVPVFVAPVRLEGVRAAADAGCDCAVVDDGFQHRRLARDLDIVLVAAEQGMSGPRLPCGPFREGPVALGRAHVVVVTRKTATVEQARDLARRVGGWAPQAVVGRIALSAASWVELDLATPSVGPPREAAVLVLASVANPESVRDLAALHLGRAADELDLLTFRDHHEYSEVDGRRIEALAGERWLVTTEKDAVKLDSLLSGPLALRTRVLRLGVEWEQGEAAVREALRAALRRLSADGPRRHPRTGAGR